jgi:NAD(P)H-dependent FMN reductase
MSKLKIAIIVSTTRATRFGHKPAQWVKDIAAQRSDIDAEVIDLRDFPMPFFDEVASKPGLPRKTRLPRGGKRRSQSSTATSS